MPKLSQVRLTKRVVDAALPGDCISDAEVRGFRLIVSPKGARRFVATYRRKDGRQSMAAIGPYPIYTVDEARELAREIVRLAKSGHDPAVAKRSDRTAPALTDLFALYVEDYAHSQNLRLKTVQQAKSALQPALKAMGNKKVADVTITDIRKLHGDVRAAGVESGTKGVYCANRMLAFLSKMFSLSIERGWRSDNPCKGVKKFPEEERWRNLSEGEVGRLLWACDEYALERPEDATAMAAADAVRLLLFTGARLQEVLKAGWSQFDLERGVWEKPSAHTKTKKQHWVELEGPALDLLNDMRDRAAHASYLFPGEPRIQLNGEITIKPRIDLKKPWAWIREKAVLADTRLHDLRRTTASFMLSDGASLATVGKALGHTQASTTQRYAHLSQTVQREALKLAGMRMASLKRAPAGANNVTRLKQTGG
jgi:integrase